jgi:hypothetical protein
MKFLQIKDMDLAGPDRFWLDTHRANFLTDPSKFRAEYAKLVSTLGKLHVIEDALRKQVLDTDGKSSPLLSLVSVMLPAFGVLLSRTPYGGAWDLFVAFENALHSALNGNISSPKPS